MILIYTVSTLAKLFSLDTERLEALVESEGVAVYDGKSLSKVGYIPTLGSYFKLDTDTERKIHSNIKEEWFSVKKVNDIITVTVKEPLMPVTAYLFSRMYEELEPEKGSSILLPSLPGKKLFIAENLLIRRLSQGVADDYTILPFAKDEGDKGQ